MLVCLLFLILNATLIAVFCRQRKALLTLTLIVVSYSFFWLLVLSYELNGGSYGSDELFYISAMQSVTRGLSTASVYPASGFVYFGSWVLKSAFFDDVFWLRLSNVAVYSLGVNLLYVLYASRLRSWYRINLSPNVPASLGNSLPLNFSMFACNGIIIWTILRILKEPLLLLLLILVCCSLEMLFHKRNGWLTRMALTLLIFAIAWIIRYLRPGAEMQVIAMFIGFAIAHALARSTACRGRTRRIGILLVASVGVVAIGLLYKHQLAIHLDYVVAYEKLYGNSFDDSMTYTLKSDVIWGVPASFFRFFLGPGPFRAVQQILDGNIFVDSCRTGDVLILLGALHWWFILIYAVFCLRAPQKAIWCMRSLVSFMPDFLIGALLHIGMYVFIYAGTGDTRHRAVLYVLMTPLLLFGYQVISMRKMARSWHVHQRPISTAGFQKSRITVGCRL